VTFSPAQWKEIRRDYQFVLPASMSPVEWSLKVPVPHGTQAWPDPGQRRPPPWTGPVLWNRRAVAGMDKAVLLCLPGALSFWGNERRGVPVPVNGDEHDLRPLNYVLKCPDGWRSFVPREQLKLVQRQLLEERFGPLERVSPRSYVMRLAADAGES